MITNPVFILALIGLFLVIISYWPGAPTHPIATIVLAIALIVLAAK